MVRKLHEVYSGERRSRTSYWPEGDNKRHWDSPDTWANAAENVVLEWWDIDPNDTDAIMTCLLLNYPVAVDIPAWGHSVCLIDPVDAAGKEFDQLNSWGNNWNGNGIGRLKGKYTRFSSAIACTVVTGGCQTPLLQGLKHVAILRKRRAGDLAWGQRRHDAKRDP
jgi:hypothetical protein